MHKAKKSLGQNFLTDELVLSEIVQAAELSPEDTVLEIGPGKGALTSELISSGAKVIAVEIDEDLLPRLKADFGHHTNFELIHHDALTYRPPSTPYKIVANIPYYISSPLLNHYLLEQFQDGNPPRTIVFMMQREVAEKILAKKGKHSVLSLQVHLFGDPELICIAPKTCFDPQPKVDSAVVKIQVHQEPKIHGDLKKILWLFHVSFKQKRKKLANNLSNAFKKPASKVKSDLQMLGINPEIRAEALTLEEWEKLIDSNLS